MSCRSPGSPTLATIMAFALLVAACSGSVDELRTASDSTTATAPVTDPPTTPTTGESNDESGIFDFEATLLGGAAFSSADYAGRDVLVWFWAPW